MPASALVADPAETAARRGRKQRAKTDDSDCELQLRLLLGGELPEAWIWIPPAQILDLRTRVRLRKTLIDQRTAWLQRLQAQLFHQGVPPGADGRPRARLGGRRACEGGLEPRPGHRPEPPQHVVAHAAILPPGSDTRPSPAGCEPDWSL